MSDPFEALLSEALAPQPFVRRALSLLESDFRKVALLALSEWHRLRIPSTDLFQAIASIQRPSWGHWNGLLSALRSVRKTMLRSARPEQRQALQQAALLNRLFDALDERVEETWLEPIRPLATMLNQKLRSQHRVSQLLALPIAMRNRIVHDAPTASHWWQEAADALRPLLHYHAHRQLLEEVRQGRAYTTPWFWSPSLEQETHHEPAEPPAILKNTDEVWSFNGLAKDFSVIYVNPGHGSRQTQQQSQSTLLAFQRMLGRTESYEGDFRKLLSKAAPEDLKGVIMGDFLVGRPVGSGGFATVHVGLQLSTGRKVAVKILHDGMDEEMKERFRQEARYLSQFRHPHIVGVIRYGEDTWSAPRQPDLVRSLKAEPWYQRFSKSAPVKTYIVLEWIEGFTLETLFNARFGATEPKQTTLTGEHRAAMLRPSLRQLAQWFAQAANALTAVHALGLIHRDVKPANLMINERGQLKLMDFGIARSQDENRTLVTTFGQGVGTPAYMSPEQLKANDEEAAVGPATDVYSLSATFYELFTGERLYKHDKVKIETVQTKKLDGELPPTPRAIVDGLPWEIETILMGGLQVEIADRYPSVEALERDLQRFLVDQPITYKSPSLWRQLQLNYKRHQRIYHIVALFLILGGGGLLAHIGQLGEEQLKTSRALKKAQQAQRDVVKAYQELAGKQRELKQALKAKSQANARVHQQLKALREAQARTLRAMHAAKIAQGQSMSRRKQLLRTQMRFLKDRLKLLKQSYLKRDTTETLLHFFQQVLDEPANPPAQQTLAAQGVLQILAKGAKGRALTSVHHGGVLMGLTIVLLKAMLYPHQKRRKLRCYAAQSLLLLVDAVPREAPRYLRLLQELSRNPKVHKRWAKSIRLEGRWLSRLSLLYEGLYTLVGPEEEQVKALLAASLIRLGRRSVRVLEPPAHSSGWFELPAIVAALYFLYQLPGLKAAEGMVTARELCKLVRRKDIHREAIRYLEQQGAQSTPYLLHTQGDVSWKERRLIRKVVRGFGKKAIPFLIAALGDTGRYLSYFASQRLAQLEVSVTWLAPLLNDANPQKRRLVRKVMRKRLDHQQVRQTFPPGRLFEAFLKSARPRSSLLAMVGLYRAEQIKGLLPKVEALWREQKLSRRSRWASLRLLEKMPKASLIRPFERLLHKEAATSPSSVHARLSLSLLGRLGEKHLVTLLRGLTGAYSRTRQGSLEGLRRMGEKIVPTLRKYLKENKRWLAHKQVAVLLAPFRGAAALSLLDTLARHRDNNVRYAAYTSLGKAGKVALAILKRHLDEADPQAQQALYQALANVGIEGSRLLVRLAKRSPSKRRLIYSSLSKSQRRWDLRWFLLVMGEHAPRYLSWRLRRRALRFLRGLSDTELLHILRATKLHRELSSSLTRVLHKRKLPPDTLASLLVRPISLAAKAAITSWLTRQPYLPQETVRILRNTLNSAPQSLHWKLMKSLKKTMPFSILMQEYMLSLLRSHRSAKVRRMALQALFQDPTTSQKVLQSALRLAIRSPSLSLRVAALMALQKRSVVGWMKLLHPLRQEKMATVLRHLARLLALRFREYEREGLLWLFQLRRSQDRVAQREATLALCKHQPKRLEEWLGASHQATHQMRLAYLVCIAKTAYKSKATTLLLRQMLQSKRPDEQHLAAYAIGCLGAKHLVWLERLLQQNKVGVVRQLLRGLKDSDHWAPKLRSRIMDLLSHTSYNIRRGAAKMLLSRPERSAAFLKKLLESPDYYTRKGLVQSLGRVSIPSRRKLRLLSVAAADPYAGIRLLARRAIWRELSRMPVSQLLHMPMTLLTRQQRKIALLLRPSHRVALLENFAHVSIWLPQRWWLGGFGAWHNERTELLQLAEEMCDPRTLPFAVQMLRLAQAPFLRAQAALQLGAWGAAVSDPYLRLLLIDAAKDKEPLVRAAAQVALNPKRQHAPPDPAPCFTSATHILWTQPY